jgi:CHC2 zinc finger
MPTISTQWDIVSLIEHFAPIQIANKGRPSTSNGVLEYHSNCPWCPDSEDSFIMQPELGRYSHAIRSSGCNRHGDCIDFLKDYKGMTHSEACDFLGIEHNADFVPSTPAKSAQNGKEQPPCKLWQSTGRLLVDLAVSALWKPSGKDMLDYLHARGLRDETIKKHRLGYIPLQSNGRFYEADLDKWGLDQAQVQKDKVRIPNGILIPWFEGDVLWRLALKRPGEKQGYGQVIGSGEGLFNVDSIQYDAPCIMTEAEFCAMVVEQEAGVPCVATGSTTRARLSRWVAELHLASYVLQSFDEDEPGDTGAEYWIDNLKKCMRWSPYVAKDPNDILMQKFLPDATPCTLQEWIDLGIQSARVEFGYASTIVEPAPTNPPCKVGLLQSRNHLPGWTDKDEKGFKKSLSKVQISEIDLKSIVAREYIKEHLAPGICLNKDCPCGDRLLRK